MRREYNLPPVDHRPQLDSFPAPGRWPAAPGVSSTLPVEHARTRRGHSCAPGRSRQLPVDDGPWSSSSQLIIEHARSILEAHRAHPVDHRGHSSSGPAARSSGARLAAPGRQLRPVDPPGARSAHPVDSAARRGANTRPRHLSALLVAPRPLYGPSGSSSTAPGANRPGAWSTAPHARRPTGASSRCPVDSFPVDQLRPRSGPGATHPAQLRPPIEQLPGARATHPARRATARQLRAAASGPRSITGNARKLTGHARSGSSAAPGTPGRSPGSSPGSSSTAPVRGYRAAGLAGL